MPGRTLRTLRTLGLVVAALGVIALASSTFAQSDHSTVVRVLRDSSDFRARVRAALALGASGDRAVATHLVAALSDESPAVRAAAATALGRLGDRSALDPLRRASRDGASIVRTEAERAIARIEASAPIAPTAPPRSLTRTASGAVMPSFAVVPRASDINWGTVRYVVVVGDLQNRSTFRDGSLDQVLDREVMRNLIVLRGVGVLREDQLSSDSEQQIRRRRLPKLRLEGSLNRVERRSQSRQVSVRCEVSLMLLEEPGRNIRSVLNGAATGVSPQRGTRADQERQLAEQALSGAVRSAMSGAARAIASARP